MDLPAVRQPAGAHSPAPGEAAAPAPPHRVSAEIYWAGRSVIVPSRAPVAKSRTRSCRPPSGNARSRIRRFDDVVIVSIRAPAGISIALAAKGRSMLAPGRSRDILPAMPAIRAAKPITSSTPITTTRIFSARIDLNRVGSDDRIADRPKHYDG